VSSSESRQPVPSLRTVDLLKLGGTIMVRMEVSGARSFRILIVEVHAEVEREIKCAVSAGALRLH
jgi:hypothetical protein